MQERTITLEALAKLTSAKLIGNPDYSILAVADLESATANDVSFLSNPRYEQSMKRSSAGAFFVPPSYKLEDGKNFLIVEDPSAAFQKAIHFFFEGKGVLTGLSGIHPTAIIHPSSKLGKNLTIGPYVTIDQDATIGDETQILAGASIGPGVSLGSSCIIHSHVTIREHCLIGNRVIIQPGAVIGSCGFGYITNHLGKHIKLEQLGTVTIEDDVEIGANTTIDRSRFKTTLIKQGTKIDNQVQIGHGATVGEHNIIVAQVGIAGSSETGNYVVLGGQVGVAGHITIGSKVMVAAKSGISKNLDKPGNYGGVPAVPFDDYQRRNVYLKNIEKYVKAIKALEERIAALEKLSS